MRVTRPTMFSLRTVRRALSVVLYLTVLANFSWSQKTSPITTVILVRHAEKDTVGTDPSLTRAGVDRSQALAQLFGNSEISTIYVTQFRRTQQTAEPLATRLRVKPVVFNVDLSNPRRYANALAKEILTKCAGSTVLVSNHSNLIPLIIDALGAGGNMTIDDHTYDDVFVVSRNSSGSARLLKLKYGNPSH
jgi:phosphohistidine phosphatase SixA